MEVAAGCGDVVMGVVGVGEEMAAEEVALGLVAEILGLVAADVSWVAVVVGCKLKVLWVRSDEVVVLEAVELALLEARAVVGLVGEVVYA
ncbi:hypothetical protein APUTEX25_000570 [Auxenochlorella protothecoides]|uniref:Uncharacterized protein n=1 Tax=Auxenochlorella protothecoides TaxID=3075 RepID=A0A3M7KSE3_AUXPR|nr:hypothetical protein APUTEX25_000570 [Auxenochlorella protothecoides]|eukprot:RMZ52302.1 hypothetical protein APUTEX25_000570 [Auxenochlorella protothecoides]